MLTVRPGKPGWTVQGKDRTGRKVRIFCTTKGAAEHIRDRLAQGFSINALDFQPRGER
jgi:hypothetical protein